MTPDTRARVRWTIMVLACTVLALLVVLQERLTQQALNTSATWEQLYEGACDGMIVHMQSAAFLTPILPPPLLAPPHRLWDLAEGFVWFALAASSLYVVIMLLVMAWHARRGPGLKPAERPRR